MSTTDAPFIHELSRVDEDVVIGPGTRVWAHAHVRTGARIGSDCVIGTGVTVDTGVTMGDRCKVQNAALLYSGVRLGDGVFVGPAAVLTNDRVPRAVNPEGAPRAPEDWQHGQIVVDDGASIGANATVVAGVRIGAWSMVAAGAVVTRDVAAHALVAGVPARRIAWVCACGERSDRGGDITCAACGRRFRVAD